MRKGRDPAPGQTAQGVLVVPADRMQQYNGSDITICVPDDWSDRSIVAYAPPSPPGAGESYVVVTIRRSPMNIPETLMVHADRVLVDMARQLHAFDLLWRQTRVVSGQPAVDVRFSWVSNQRRLEQRVVMLPGHHDCAIHVTGTAGERHGAAMEEAVERVIEGTLLAPGRRAR